MKATFFAVTSFLATLFLYSSCQKYLDLKASANVSIPSNLDDVEYLLNNSQFLNFSSASLGNGSTDDLFLAPSVYQASSERERDAYRWEWQDYNFANEWSRTYRAVNITNVCLEALDRIERTDSNVERWNHLRGAALVFRAFHFLNAIWTYSLAYDKTSSVNEPGIVLRVSTDVNEMSKRSTVEECYNKILSDLEEAAPMIRTTSELPVLPTRATAYALLARTYLSMRKYDEALHYSNLCLSLKSDLLDYGTDISISSSLTTPFERFNKEVIFTAQAFPSYNSERPSHASVDTGLVNQYEPNDLRKQAFFATRSNGTIQFKGVYGLNANDFFTGITTAEMYLIRSECLARAGEVHLALEDLNTLLKKRWDKNGVFEPKVAEGKETALELILLERRKELVTRNLRYIDIKRLNKEGRGLSLTRIAGENTVSLLPNDRRWAFPLPADIIAQTQMPQNEY